MLKNLRVVLVEHMDDVLREALDVAVQIRTHCLASARGRWSTAMGFWPSLPRNSWRQKPRPPKPERRGTSNGLG